MKKPLLTLCFGLAIGAQAQTAITLNQSNAPTNPIGIDTMYNAEIVGIVPSMAAATNARWDFSKVTYNTVRHLNTYSAATGFPSAQYANLINYNLAEDIEYSSSMMFSIGAQGIINHGEQLERQAFNIGDVDDSLIVLEQNVIYTTPQTVLPYPATMGTTWQSSFSGTTELILNYPSMGMFNTPAQRKMTVTTNNSVVGWGLVWVALKDGRSSGSMPVLQVQTSIKIIDSFFINGSPAPQFLLNMFDLTQGEEREVFQRNYYRAKEVTPLVSVTFADNAYNVLQDLNIHRQRLQDPTSVGNIDATSKIAVYPNPAKNVINLSFKNALSGNIGYELININGQKAGAGALIPASSKSEYAINIPENIASGMYYISINKDGEKIGTEMVYINK